MNYPGNLVSIEEASSAPASLLPQLDQIPVFSDRFWSILGFVVFVAYLLVILSVLVYKLYEHKKYQDWY